MIEVNLQRIDHTAIVVRDLNEAIDRYQRLLDVRAGERVLVPTQRVAVVFLSLGDTQLELIQPTDAESGTARFLARRGEGLHHIGILVHDIEGELQRLAADGVELIDREPRPGVHGRIAFVHPRASGGVLLELIEHNTIE